jgi:hypothetical protein
MTRLSVEQASILYSIQSPAFSRIREITSDPFDFGDEASIGCCVKSVNWATSSQFGTFIGKLTGGYTIVVYDVLCKILGAEQFETVEEMHKIWRVD